MSISIIAFAMPAVTLANTSNVEAENMSWPSGSGQIKSDGGATVYWLWRNDVGTGSITTTQALQEVSVRLRSEQTNKGDVLHPCQGSPQFSLFIDGVSRATWTLAPSTSYSTFTLAPQSLGGINTAPGTHTVGVKLNNDYDSTTNPCDRNLYVDKVIVSDSNLFAPTNWRNVQHTSLLDDPATITALGNQVRGGVWVNKTDDWTVPVYTVNGTQTRVPVIQDTRWPQSNYYGADAAEWTNQLGSVPIPSNAKAAGPADCTSDGEWTGPSWDHHVCVGAHKDWGDREIAIYQPSTDTLWELYHLVKSGGQWAATDGGRISNVSQATQYDSQPFPTGIPHGVAATRLPLMATLPRTNEVLSGVIPHAIPLHLPYVTPSVFAAPALATDGDWSGLNGIKEGTRFRLPDAIDVNQIQGLTNFGRIIAKAAQDYGFVVTDKDCWPSKLKVGESCGLPAIILEDPAPAYGTTDPYGIDAGTALANFPWADLKVASPTN